MTDNVIKLVDKKQPEDGPRLADWLRQYADQLEKENRQGVTRAILLVVIEDGDKSLQRHWKYNASLLETVGMLHTASFDRLQADDA